MPIPTDTYWNIKRLNILFAVSAVIMMLTLVWATFQDFFQKWREPQRDGKVWQAALVDEKIERDLTPEKEARIKQLQSEADALKPTYGADAPETKKRKAVLRQLESEQSKMEFDLNTLKALVTVDESQLQDAITAGDKARVKHLNEKLAEPRKKLVHDTEAMAAKKEAVAQARLDLQNYTAPLDAKTKEITKLQADIEALKKKRAALVPKGLFPNLSNQMRETPLMQFINPATRVRQVVLADVRTSLGGVKEVETIDRCMTCHVNIDNKDFAEPKVLAYLEEQVASSRDYVLPATWSGKASDPLATRMTPGAVAMPEFWHLYAATVAPEIVKRPANLTRINTLAASVGKIATVTVDRKKLDTFKYVADATPTTAPAAAAPLDQRTRDLVIAELLKTYIGYGSKPATSASSNGRVKVTLKEGLTDKDLAPLRIPAMRYAEDVKAGVTSTLSADEMKLLNDRYRRAMVAEANIARGKQGLKQLDPSPAMLAHPRLDLYVDIDSKHSFEAVGCTSCHDGSGQETHFVLTAHTPRAIWVDQKTGESVLPEQIDTAKITDGHHGEDLSSMLEAVWPEDELAPLKVADIHLGAAHDDAEHGEHQSPTTAPAASQPTLADVTVEKQHPVPEATTDPDAAVIARPIDYINPLTGEARKAVPQMRQWIDTYEPGAPRGFKLVYHEWDWPMRPPRYLQANCVRCHNDVNSIKEEAPKVFEGRSLFINQGCANCHQMDSIPPESLPEKPSDLRLITANGQRKVGTDLRNINVKLSKAYVNTWIWAPKAFRPSTKMPHFFMLENNASDEEIKRTRQEARSITEYLFATTTTHPQTGAKSAVASADAKTQVAVGPLPVEHPIPPGGKGSAEAGRSIFTSIGCQGCHTNLNDPSGETRNKKPVTLGEKWIVTDLVKSGKLARQMEAQLGKAPDAKAVTTRAQELYDAMSYNERQLYLSENLAPNYAGETSKYPDNTPKPIFQHHGPELSGIGTKLTAGGRKPEEARQWLFDWVRNPRHYSEYTVMPNLRLNDQQALDLVEYLLAQKRTNDKPDDPWQAELTEPDTKKLIELTSLFLRSRFSVLKALEKADDDAELLALASDALTTAYTTPEVAKERAAKMSKDEQRMVFLGKKLISHYGCMSCHAINGAEQMSSPCANLSDWGQKAVDKLDFGYLDHHKAADLPPTHKIEMVNGLSARAATLTSPEYRANFETPNVAQPVDVAWPHVGHSRTGWLRQKLNNTRAYDRGKVLLDPDPKSDDPQIRSGKPYDKLKMPTFYLNDREIDAVVTWVISNRDRLISEKLRARTVNDDAQRIARGRQLVQKFNCVGCHVIDGNAPSVQQYYKAEEITTKAPPSLRGEGNKIQHTWLFNFLKNVEPLRPLLTNGIRMPSFFINDDEATSIAAYFNAESRKESARLKKQLDVVQKYVQTKREAALKQPIPPVSSPTTLPSDMAQRIVGNLIDKAGALIADHQYAPAADALKQADAIASAHKMQDPASPTTKPISTRLQDSIKQLASNQVPTGIPWPGDDWYQQPSFATPAETLKRWALMGGFMRDIQFDTTKQRPDDIARTHRLLLMESEFVRHLFDSPYPFVETPRPNITPERFKKGETMFYEMQCLKCHVLGDPNVPGAQKNPTAPNLTLAHRRLQRRWIRNWVQEPDIIQLQTAMPPFFTGKPVFDPHGQSWPRAQSTVRPADQVEADYGKTADEQTDLLLDFLYAAGVNGHTGIQPAGAPAPTPQVQQRNPEKGVPPTAPPTATQPFLPGDATKGKAAEPPGAPSPKSPQDSKSAKPAPPAPAAPTPKAQEKTVTPKPEASKPAAPKPEAKPQASAAPPSGDISIKGVVTLDGKAPEMKEIDMSAVKECATQHADPVYEETIVASEKGQLKNVVLTISAGLPQQNYDPPPEAAVLDQHGCMYHPHVLVAMVGQKIVVQNSDTFLHNVHALANDNVPFNFGQPNVAKNPIDPLKTPETFRVKCDVHPWMSAYVVGVDNPFFATSGDDGSFAIPGKLPPGDYTLKAWHETLGTQEIPVKVEAGKPAVVEIKFKAP